MSFVKIPRRTARPGASSQKRRSRKKPEWDDTNNDLTVHKATTDEIARRKFVHTSNNMDLVQAEKLHKKITKAKKQKRTPGKQKQMPLLREVLYDSNQIQDVLAKSDRAMAVVRDLFGDDPKRYRGLPNVTAAPQQMYLDGSLPTGTTIDGPSKLDILSDSVMDKSALNDVGAHDTETEDEDAETLQYKPLLDFGRFRKFLEAEQTRAKEEDNVEKQKDAQEMAKRLEEEMQELGIKSPENGNSGIPVTSPHDGSFIEENTPAKTPKLKAMNDTGKVNRVRSRLTHTEQNESQMTNTRAGNDSTNNSTLTTTFNMDDLRKVLDGLEGNLAAYERQTGRPNSSRSAPPETFSGYTMSLVNAVNKLTVYLKESEIRLRAETTLREQLTEDVDQLKGLVDTLTSDIIGMQEDYTTQQDEFYKYRLITQQELYNIKTALIAQGVPVHSMQQPEEGGQPARRNVQPEGGVSQPTGQNTQPEMKVPLQQPAPLPPSVQHPVPATIRQQQPAPHQQSHVLQQPKQGPSQSQHQATFQQNRQQQQYQQQQHQYQQQQQQQQYQRQQLQQQQQTVPQNPASHDLSSQQLQMFMLQQLAISQGLPMQAILSDLSQYNQTADSGSLEQHPLSSSQTSLSTVRTVSSGRPVPNLPVETEPSSVLPARLLSPPRQTNSPQVQNKTKSQNTNLAATMGIFRQEGLIGNLKNAIHNQQVAAQNVDLQMRPGQGQESRVNTFRPKPVDNGATKLTESQYLYLTQSQRPAHNQQDQLCQDHLSTSSQQRLAQTQQQSAQVEQRPHTTSQQHAVQNQNPQQVHNASMVSNSSGGPAERLEKNRELLARQIEELNRQHAEAEGKLERLSKNHYLTARVLTQEAPPSHISPSISPIPAGSESDTAVTHLSNISTVNFTRDRPQEKCEGPASQGTRGITVSLPRMEMLNWSDTSTPTLSSSKTVSRRDSNSPVPIMTISPSDNKQTPYKDNQKVNPQSAFFALSTHVA